jgi:hypothetical protein
MDGRPGSARVMEVNSEKPPHIIRKSLPDDWPAPDPPSNRSPCWRCCEPASWIRANLLSAGATGASARMIFGVRIRQSDHSSNPTPLPLPPLWLRGGLAIYLSDPDSVKPDAVDLATLEQPLHSFQSESERGAAYRACAWAVADAIQKDGLPAVLSGSAAGSDSEFVGRRFLVLRLSGGSRLAHTDWQINEAPSAVQPVWTTLAVQANPTAWSEALAQHKNAHARVNKNRNVN